MCLSLSLLKPVLLSVDLTVPNLLVDPFDAGSLGIADSYRLVPLVCGGWWVVGGGAAASGESPVFVSLNESVEIIGNSNNKKTYTSRRELCKVQPENRSVQELFLQNISVPHTCKASLPSKPQNPKP